MDFGTDLAHDYTPVGTGDLHASLDRAIISSRSSPDQWRQDRYKRRRRAGRWGHRNADRAKFPERMRWTAMQAVGVVTLPAVASLLPF